MRKLIFVMVVLGLLVCGCALAEGPTNPYFVEAQAPRPVPISRGETKVIETGIVAGSILDYNSIDENGSWRATAYYVITDDEGNEKKVAGTFEYCFYITTPEGDVSITHGYQPYSSTRTFTYDFVIPGTYNLWVYARDAEGRSARAIYKVKVNDENAITEAEKINQIVVECEAAGCETDYDKALWLHDWLTNNSYYDYSLSYYSSDGVLVRGTGVCDSYSRAYVKLLSAVGIRSQYLPSPDMGHSWNLVLLDGKWHHVDTTWDDATPKGVTKPLCGLEKHIYFGLNDEFMAYDHVFSTTTKCTSLESNYFMRGGGISKWYDPLEKSLQLAIDNGRNPHALPLPSEFSDEHGRLTTINRDIIYGLCANLLREKTWDAGIYKDLAITLVHDREANAYRYALPIPEEILNLPSALKAIHDYAFAGSKGFTVVKIPEGTLSIGDGAFSDCDTLWTVYIPESVVSISPDAFDDSPFVTIVCKAGSPAESYAKAYMPDRYRIEE